MLDVQRFLPDTSFSNRLKTTATLGNRRATVQKEGCASSAVSLEFRFDRCLAGWQGSLQFLKGTQGRPMNLSANEQLNYGRTGWKSFSSSIRRIDRGDQCQPGRCNPGSRPA